MLEKAKGRFSRLKLIWADGGYAGQLIGWVQEICGWILEIVKRSDDNRLCRAAQTMDCGTDIWLVRLVSSVEQGLRRTDGEQRSDDCRVHDSPYATPSRVSRTGRRMGDVTFQTRLRNCRGMLDCRSRLFEPVNSVL